MKFKFLETPEEISQLAEFIGKNPDIPLDDVNGLKASPSSVVLMVSDDEGKVLLMLPWYPLFVVPFFGFNPEANPRERIKAMNAALPIIEAAAKRFGIAHIAGMTRPEYGIAQWAMKHGFEPDQRQAFVKTLEK